MGPLSWPLNENGGRPPEPSREARVVGVDLIRPCVPHGRSRQSRGPSRRVMVTVDRRSGCRSPMRRTEASRHAVAMRTQQYPGSGSRRAVSSSVGPIPWRRPRRKSRFMPQTRVRCCRASRWNGQLVGARSRRGPGARAGSRAGPVRRGRPDDDRHRARVGRGRVTSLLTDLAAGGLRGGAEAGRDRRTRRGRLVRHGHEERTGQLVAAFGNRCGHLVGRGGGTASRADPRRARSGP